MKTGEWRREARERKAGKIFAENFFAGAAGGRGRGGMDVGWHHEAVPGICGGGRFRGCAARDFAPVCGSPAEKKRRGAEGAGVLEFLAPAIANTAGKQRHFFLIRDFGA